MAKTIKYCHLCAEKAGDDAVKQDKARKPVIICGNCLDRIFPERSRMDVVVDDDANLYFVDNEQRRLYLFFSYGNAPYASCTELSLDDIDDTCMTFTRFQL